MLTRFKANALFSRSQDELEREEGNWVKYMGQQQHRRSALDIIRDPSGNSLKLEQLLQQQKQQQQQQQQQPTSASEATLIRYITACDTLQAAPQVSFLPGFQQQKLEAVQTAEDGFQIARAGLRDKGLQARACACSRAVLCSDFVLAGAAPCHRGHNQGGRQAAALAGEQPERRWAAAAWRYHRRGQQERVPGQQRQPFGHPAAAQRARRHGVHAAAAPAVRSLLVQHQAR